MPDLTSAITEALDQAERLARGVLDDVGKGSGQAWIDDEGRLRLADAAHGLRPAVTAFILATSPATVLRAVAADRRVLERHAPKTRGSLVLCAWCCEPSDAFPEVEWPCDEIRDLADRLGLGVTGVETP